MSVDPVYNGPSGYVGMLNNPVSTIDPNGEEPVTITTALVAKAVIKAAVIGGVSYTASIALSDGGFNNWDWGQFGQSVAIGAVSGAVTFGIGTGYDVLVEKKIMGQVLADISRISTHASFQGGLSTLQGGDFWVAFGASLAGSMVGLGTKNWQAGFAREATSIGSAMLIGGATARLSGGEFWRGAAVAGIVVSANDLAHNLGLSPAERAALQKQRKIRKAQNKWLKQEWLPLPGELEKRFGKTWREDFVKPFVEKFSSELAHPREIINHVREIDFEYILRDETGILKLTPVFGRYAVQDTGGNIVFDEAPFSSSFKLIGPRGVVTNPGTGIVSFYDPIGSFHALTITFNVIIPQ